jgi:hypothetical protein
MANEYVGSNPSVIRVINDQKLGFEKNFLFAEGLPDRIQYRHVISAPSLFNAVKDIIKTNIFHINKLS